MIAALRRFLVARRLGQARRELELMRGYQRNAAATVDELQREISSLEVEETLLRLEAGSRFRFFTFWTVTR